MTEDLVKFESRTPDKEFSPPAPTGQTSEILLAIQKGYTPEFIEKLMDLKERNDANEARKAYYEAVANFKAAAPKLKKDKYNKFFDSWYTSLGNLLDTYNPYLGENGLSISHPTPAQTEKSMTVECRLAHRQGHSESISITAPIDEAAIGKQSGQRSRTPIQDIKSTFTYLRSATCEAILGVSGSEASVGDDDGNSAGGIEYITDKQLSTLTDMILDKEADEEKFLKHYHDEFSGAKTLKEIPAKKYGMALQALKDKKTPNISLPSVR